MQNVRYSRSETQSDDQKSDDDKAYRTVLDEAEAKEKEKIKERKDDREPCISIHHGQSGKVEDPLLCRHLHFRDREIKCIKKDIYVKREHDPL